MRSLRYGLVTDGSSDRCLETIIVWVLERLVERQSATEIEVTGDFINPLDFDPSTRSTKDRLHCAAKIFDGDLLFVHRDAERAAIETRFQEIADALEGVEGYFVPIIPVRMTEAWLLLDESAIRKAADNPNGRSPLKLPKFNRIESCPNPKQKLEDALCDASGKSGRKLDRFKKEFGKRRQRIVQHMRNFEALRELPAFRTFENRTSVAFDAWFASRKSAEQ